MAAGTTTVTIKMGTTRLTMPERPAHALESLYEIFERHLVQNDHLSKRLRAWTQGSLSFEWLDKDPETVLANIVKRVDALFKILRNPLDNAPLEHPLLIGGIVWEKAMFEDYTKTIAELEQKEECPIRKIPLEAPVEHAYAKEMIEWARALPRETSSTLSLHVDKDPYLDLTLPAEEKLSIYRSLGETARSILFAQHCELELIRIQEETEIARFNFEQEKARVESQIDTHRKETLEHISEIRDTHRSAVHELEGRASTLEETVRHRDKAIDHLHGRISQSEATLRMLAHRLAEAQRRVSELENEDRGGFCSIQ